ncbi:MAG: hypothetical protein Q9219_006463, partial [cf. Caloplaca sp. 3 TL-2023]
MSQSPSEKRFKVIVVGAGVSGLTLSHALTKAKIDHVVLERGEIAPARGSSIGIHPHGCRILDQLGCLGEIERLCVPMKEFVNRLPNGSVLTRSNFFDFIAQRNGYNFLNLERQVFLRSLYEMLPNKAVVKARQNITDIIESLNGVKVVLADGTVEFGDVVVGCDGVNSFVRQIMLANAERQFPGCNMLKAKKKHGFSFLFLSQPQQIYFFVFSKLPDQIIWPDTRRWTDEDAEAVAAKVQDHPVSEDLSFGTIWRTRIRGQLVPIEEGIFKHWYSRRIVLAGDAVHKVTPNFALGGNMGIESVTALTNELHHLIETTPHGKPTAEAIANSFQRYQDRRVRRVRKIYSVSSFITRLQAYDGILMSYIAQWVVPYLIGDERIADQLCHICATSPKLNFIRIKPRKGSQVPFYFSIFKAVIMKAVIIKDTGKAEQQHEDGAYAEFAMVKDGHLAKIPEGMSFEETASMGAGVTTVGQALYENLKLPWPTKPTRETFPILIYGGSTATGTLAIQYAKLSGLTVITTASPKNFSLLQSLGADAVFDYNDPECGSKIRAHTNNSLRYVFDCISVESSYKIDAAALSSDSSKELHCLALLPTDSWPSERKDVNVRWLLAYTSFGEQFDKFGATWPAIPEHYEMGVKFWELNGKYLSEGKVKPHPVTVNEGGLSGIPAG